MAEILITGIEMPVGNKALLVDSAGTITKLNLWKGTREATDPFSVKAWELPPHGGLKDYDALGFKMTRRYEKNKEKWNPDFIDGFMYALKMLDKAPVVIPASEG